MVDVQQQLSDLLGRQVKQIRTTSENPPRVSVIDVAILVTGKDQNNSAKDFRRLLADYPEVDSNCDDFQFPGKGQRSTKVTDARGVVEIIMLLPGRHAARVRRQAAELLVRYLGGDIALVVEICRNRGLQEELAVRAPDHPMRGFGADVEASGPGGDASEQLMNVCTEVLSRAFPEILQRLTDHMTAHIDQRLVVFENRQRVNLNVRAPKRTGPYTPAITRHVAGQPYPVAKFLDEKERQDPTWKDIRRSFAPTFSMQVQVLKKKQLKDKGKTAVYVEQNHRPQLYYTVEDKEIMESAWELTSAHREDLAGKSHHVVQRDRPSVLSLLQRP